MLRIFQNNNYAFKCECGEMLISIHTEVFSSEKLRVPKYPMNNHSDLFRPSPACQIFSEYLPKRASEMARITKKITLLVLSQNISK